MLMRTAGADTGLFHFVMIKPSHYDDDGYPIQWFRSAIPSNTLACLNGLALDAARRNVLGECDWGGRKDRDNQQRKQQANRKMHWYLRLYNRLTFSLVQAIPS